MTMADRDRLAADLEYGLMVTPARTTVYRQDDAYYMAVADRLIALGWTDSKSTANDDQVSHALDEEGLARALQGEVALLRKACDDPDIMPIAAAAIAKTYREDTDATR